MKQYFHSSNKLLQHIFVFTKLCYVTNVDTYFLAKSLYFGKCVINGSITSDCEPQPKQKRIGDEKKWRGQSYWKVGSLKPVCVGTLNKLILPQFSQTGGLDELLVSNNILLNRFDEMQTTIQNQNNSIWFLCISRTPTITQSTIKERAAVVSLCYFRLVKSFYLL